MSYLEIIILGLFFNVIVSIIISVCYIIIFTGKHSLTNSTIIMKNIELVKLKRKFLRVNNINPYRQKDFLTWIPYMGGLMILDFFVKGTLSNHHILMNEELTESINYLNNLIKINGLNK